MMMFSASDFFDRSEQSWNQSWSPQTFTENKPLWFLHQLQVSVFFIKGAASWLSGTFVYGCSFIKTIFSLVCTQWCFLHLYSFITFNTFKLFPAVFHFSTKLSQKIIFKLFRLRLKFKQIFWNQMKWVRVCACGCACRTCLEPSSGVRCSNRRSLESLCAAEVQLMEAVRETSSRRRQRRREEEFIFVTCVSVCGSEDLLLLSRHGGSFKAPLTSLPRAVGWVWWWVEGGDWWWWWWCLVKWAGFKFLPSLPPTHFVSQPEARGQEAVTWSDLAQGRVQNVVTGDQMGPEFPVWSCCCQIRLPETNVNEETEPWAALLKSLMLCDRQEVSVKSGHFHQRTGGAERSSESKQEVKLCGESLLCLHRWRLLLLCRRSERPWA